MADKHIRIYYGKYFNDITNELNGDHFLLEEMGTVAKSIEQGEPNIPTGDKYEIALANLDPQGNQRYPISWFEDNARTEAEGADSVLQIFFKIEVLDTVQFVGMLRDIRYSDRQAKCYISIEDLSLMLRSETRPMLKEFNLKEVYMPWTGLSGDSANFNQYGPLYDLEDNQIEHEALTFIIFEEHKGRSIGPNRTGWTGRGNQRQEFINHLDLPYIEDPDRGVQYIDYENLDHTRNTYVKIGEHTIFTKVRFWGHTSETADQVRMTVYHSGEDIDPQNNIIPMGKFYRNEELDPLEAGQHVDVTIYDYDVGNTPEIILKDSDLPAYADFMFGVPFVNLFTVNRIYIHSKAWFDTVEKTTEAIEGSIGDKYGTGAFQGEINITEGSYPNAAGQEAEFAIVITAAPYDNELLKVEIEDVGYSNSIFAGSDYTPESIANTIKQGLDSSPAISEEFTIAVSEVSDGWEVRGSTRNQTDEFNGKTVILHAEETSPSGTTGNFIDPKTSFYYNPQDITGGIDGGYDGSSNITFVTNDQWRVTSGVDPDWTPVQVAQDLTDAINILSDYSATRNNTSVIITSNKGINENIDLLVRDTGVEFEVVSHIRNAIDLFDTTYLLDDHRLAFYADPVMFGWLDRSLIEILVGTVWQTSSYLYSLPDGRIAYHNRDYYETLPDDVIQDDTFATHIPADDIQPDGETEFTGGFKTYSAKRSEDLIGIINVDVDSNFEIFANKDGVVNQPSSKDKAIKISNYRTSNLGHPVNFQNAPADYAKLRLPITVPGRSVWGADEQDFLPTAEEQLRAFASAQQYPQQTRPIKVKYRDYKELKVGDYVYTDDQKLWLIKGTEVDPVGLSLRLTLEFKKQLYGLKQTFEESVSVNDQFKFNQNSEQSYSEAASVGEEFEMIFGRKFEEGVTIAEEYPFHYYVEKYEEPVSIDEEYGEQPDSPTNFSVTVVEV